MESSAHTSDSSLVQAVRQGDLAAFNELVNRYERQIAAVIMGMLGNCPEADDVGQDVFIRFYRKIDQFRGDASLLTYLTRIAINLSLNELKRRKRQQKRTVPLDTNVQIQQDNTVEFDVGTSEEIQRAVKSLPAKYQSVVLLRLVEGYSTKETAEILSLPQGTVLSRLSRAIEKLRMTLAHLENIK